MFDVHPNKIIGFYGCYLSVRNKLVNNPYQVEISNKPYDWLEMVFTSERTTIRMPFNEPKTRQINEKSVKQLNYTPYLPAIFEANRSTR